MKTRKTNNCPRRGRQKTSTAGQRLFHLPSPRSFEEERCSVFKHEDHSVEFFELATVMVENALDATVQVAGWQEELGTSGTTNNLSLCRVGSWVA
jgi:hypothetical protein